MQAKSNCVCVCLFFVFVCSLVFFFFFFSLFFFFVFFLFVFSLNLPSSPILFSRDSIEVIFPVLMEKGLLSSVETLRFFSIQIILDMAKEAGPAIR